MGLKTAAARMARIWRRPRVDEAPRQPPRTEWIDAYATRNRPILRAPEAELVLLAEVVCGELGILLSQTPTPAQEKVIHAQVAEWIREVRHRTHVDSR